MQKGNYFTWSFFGLALCQAFHSSEEILTRLYDIPARVSARIHDSIAFFPVFFVNGNVFSVINILIISSLFTVCIFVIKGKKWAALLAMIIGIIEMLNGLAHITVAIIKWNYFPGCITAFSLIIFGLMVFIYYSSHEYKKIPG